MPSGFFDTAKEHLVKGDLDWDEALGDLVAMLIKSSYTFDQTDEFVSDLVASEVACTNYAGGPDHDATDRVELVSPAITVNGETVLDADDITFSALGNGANDTIGGVVIYQSFSTVNDNVNKLIAFIELPATLTSGEDFEIQWDSTGILKLV